MQQHDDTMMLIVVDAITPVQHTESSPSVQVMLILIWLLLLFSSLVVGDSQLLSSLLFAFKSPLNTCCQVQSGSLTGNYLKKELSKTALRRYIKVCISKML